MSRTTALVVTESTEATHELDRALRADGFAVSHAQPNQLMSLPESWTPPDLVLASASLGLHVVGLLGERLVRPAKAPTIVVFPTGDFGALETCVRGGFDYVLPPFLPALLRTRLSSCWERGQLARAVEEMSAMASLHDYERDLSVAHDIQVGFLPDEMPAPDGWDLSARFRPARQVSGDFYDGFELADGRVAFVVADVCDKGLGAALFMALIRTLLRHTAQHTGAWQPLDSAPDVVTADGARIPVEALSPLLSASAGPLVQSVLGTNRYMARNHLRQGYFATMFFGVLEPDSGALLYINGGHNPPVLARPDDSYQLLPPTGPAVGLMPNSTYTMRHIQLDPGDQLFVYTDGVVEARNIDRELFGMQRMLDVVRPQAKSACGLLDAVDESVGHHVGGAEQFDDITMLALRREL